MKRSRQALGLCAAMAATTACHSVPPYKGDGRIRNTTYWADGLVRMPQYTITLISFGLDKDAEGEFDLQDMTFFRHTMITVKVRFPDNHIWWHFDKLHPSEKTAKQVAKLKMRDLDKLSSRLRYRVVTSAGNELLRSDKPFGDYTWSGSGGVVVETYNPADAGTAVERGTPLKLWFSYAGDASLTNRADLVVVCQPR